MKSYLDAFCIFMILYLFCSKWKHDMDRQDKKRVRIMFASSDTYGRVLNGNKHITAEYILVLMFIAFSTSKYISVYFYHVIGESGSLICIVLLLYIHVYVYIESDNKKLNV